MALFGTLNVAGPAHRQGTVQQLAQNAAAAVLRRQKLRQILSQAAGAGGGGAHSGPGMPLQSSMRGHGVGVRGATMRPDITPDQLAEMSRSAGRSGHLPGGLGGGVYGAGGGGFDFGALPAPADHSQSQASVGASPFHTTPVNPGGSGGGSGGGSPSPAPSNPGSFTPSTFFNGLNQGDAAQTNVHGWISLGGGLFYDPVNDIVRGPSQGNGLVGVDGKF